MELEQWLNEKQGQLYRYKMEKILYALEKLGHPERIVPAIHVAGTNGKGSTIAFLKSLFQARGLRVGTFVSPHLVSVYDRICINACPIPEAMFRQLLQEVYDLECQVAQVYEPFRYFEVLTLVMFLYFKERKPDIALIEVGIGGLLDTTNVVEPLCSIITSIGMDHQDLLGDSLEAIAEQKAGIIKVETPIILGPMEESALQICQDIAQKQGAPFFYYGRDFSLVDGVFTNSLLTIEGLNLGLLGAHQAENAALALQAFLIYMEEQGQVGEAKLIREALDETRWAGRLERVGVAGNIYLDGAHNLPAIVRLVEFIQSQTYSNATILFSALKRKDFREMLEYIQEQLPEVQLVVTHFAYDGAIEDMDCPENCSYVADYQRFIAQWESRSDKKAALFITGSLYFISEVRQYFKD